MTRLLPSGRTPQVQTLVSHIEQVAPFNTSVLVLGESGTGKERIARSIHEHSKRSDAVFVPVNCGAIPSELMESELFGHEKGAFTGALVARKGRFEMAHGGTLFLDEIGDMSLDMQVKLLRVLQERCFERVGGTSTIHCDVRIVAATHRDLKQLVAEGKFREDLYYRLNVFPIDVPPLRERKLDLAMLIRELVEENLRRGGEPVDFSSAAMAALTAYDWPGNIRELGNLVERMAILHPNAEVGATDLPMEFCGSVPQPDRPTNANWMLPEDSNIDLKLHLQQIEVQLIEQALCRSGGTVAEAARMLSIGRTTLVEKMRKYNLGGAAQVA